MVLIRKRDGGIEDFNADKIIIAITKAMNEEVKMLNEQHKELIKNIADEIIEIIEYSKEEIFSVEEIQDLVEMKLMEKDLYSIAKKYILYRAKRAEKRQEAWEMTELEEGILKNRYFQNGENFEQWLDRVSAGNRAIKKRIRNKQFLFGGRILANRGMNQTGIKSTLFNCYVLQPPQDNIEGIYQTAAEMARTYSYGGGVGISLRDLRPRGAEVGNSAKETSGAVSFMELYDLTTKIIGQAGRRGALMISMPVNHPDIEEFIDIKTDVNKITKANISIEITNEFMYAVKNNLMFKTSFKFTSKGKEQEVIKEIDAKKLFMKIAENNWRAAEPGMLFWNKISNYHFMAADPEVEFSGTNPLA